MTALIPVLATLHLELRSRGVHVGQPRTEHRTYTYAMQVNPTDEMPCLMHMIREGQTFGGGYQSTTTWAPESYDLAAGTATFRKSLKASDKLIDHLEAFGWVRQ